MNTDPPSPFDDDDAFFPEGSGEPPEEYNEEDCEDCGAPPAAHEYGIVVEKFNCELCGESISEKHRALVLSIALILAPPKNVITVSNPVGVAVHEQCIPEYFRALFDSAEDPNIPLPFQYEEDEEEMEDAGGTEAYLLDEVMDIEPLEDLLD
jgi:hypothetical protein